MTNWWTAKALRHAVAGVAMTALALSGACGSDDADDADAQSGSEFSALEGGGEGNTGEGGEGNTGEGGDPASPTSDLVVAGCIDGDYAEGLPPVTADINALKAEYSQAQSQQFILDVLEARYPTGAYIVERALAEDDQNCIDVFGFDLSSADSTISNMSTIVHECGHFLDIAVGGFSDSAYIITPGLEFTCANGSITDFGGLTFSRSLLNTDEYSQLHPPCASFGGGGACDSYGFIYLDGDPSDDDFQGGDQGFDSVLEETVQYVNSIAVSYAFEDQSQFSTSARDGILTFLWYVTRYLRMARNDYPAAYELLSQDDCWREGILQVWGRAWLYLEATEGNPKLGLDDEFLYDLATDPDLLGEIQLLRDIQGCQ